MDSYISKKFVRFLIFIYLVFIFSLASLSAFAVDGKNYEHQSQKKLLENKESENNLSDKENEKAALFAKNIQTASNVLSSSPSQLIEQAKSYALGKINSTVNGEAQKWLSQFGTAKINFSMDRKGKLDNGSLDLLLPLYDNKSDWLFFSQLGYRNKDSRHTLNLGFGGRYFTPSWMYGLNSFYDFDVTGNNKRIGLGAEAWIDYAKFSANTYWRMSDWHDSPQEKGWEERPANGFDINGEFFLPAYPNIGGKLAYEQYFGDKVALFDRDTKQKDPSLARIGVNYTPIPLVTMGIDYKLGSGGHSETLFQTNLNYRFGVPFEAQLAPDSVASMRTLAGSRHDLVERNNQIVLDYRKKGEKEVLLNIQEQNITGYSYQRWKPIYATVTPKDAKLVWQKNDSFSHALGEITQDVNPIGLTLPKFDPDTNNTYVLSFTAQDSNGKTSKPSSITVKVEPFVLKGDVTKTKVKTDNSDEVAYKFLATITHGTKDNDALARLKVSNLHWSVDKPNAENVTWVQSDTTNDLGQLEATISSEQPLKNVKVFLTMDGMSQTEVVNNLDFSKEIASGYQVNIESDSEGPLVIEKNKSASYTFTATVREANGALLKEKELNVNWHVKGDKLPDGVEWQDVKKTDKTDVNGQISAILVGKKTASDIKVGVSIDGAEPEYINKPVSFIEDSATNDIKWTPESPIYEAVADEQHMLTVLIPQNSLNKFEKKYEHNFDKIEKKYPGFRYISASSTEIADRITFTFTSTQVIESEKIEITLKEKGGDSKIIQSPPVSFKPGLNDLKISSFKVDNPSHKPNWQYIANGQDKVRLKIKILKGGDGREASNFSIDPSQIHWIADVHESLKDKFDFTLESPTTNGSGELYADMVTKVAIDNRVRVSVKIPTSNPAGEQEVTLDDHQGISFEPVPKSAMLRVFSKYDSNIIKDFGINSNGPSNVFNSLQARLLKENAERLPDVGEDFNVTYSAKVGNGSTITLINKESGLISFYMTPSNRGTRNALIEQTFKARIVNKKTQEVTAYEYLWKPIRWFLMMGETQQTHTQSEQKDAYCKSEDYLKHVRNIDVWNYDKRGDRDTLENEFPEVTSWGFFKVPVKEGGGSSDQTIMNVLNVDTDKFEALNLANLQIIKSDAYNQVFCLFRN
ncbi:inverse autotransporter beta domain-containing protein [Xenorhabdus bovienii]|uniref:inverse autotransporter beta domain-containing protein n=2 Tax=Xenorhabdus bovienii TaxID=40576 RepID=UPI00237C77A3|nr:inverse autotransporter beta domain-containing protein [Xenorhabdus bovienii]MDE1487367.1 inverse autotransporter beta domain-containing protein [Xenorhabdus bovienii]MDE1497176.1 inverse autotransporter beta domain-containing protein [Xenorhabdus bovienii]MDE9447777.1 inverse autotransporter beta domain-containing protein [Xenorhabdus bovienii]MDE9472911.1 inverse autotransporter beta domain-containing protein [Xenorhabdus bovienii]MDE9478246.1 inverse autotransporter beta domain-containin